MWLRLTKPKLAYLVIWHKCSLPREVVTTAFLSPISLSKFGAPPGSKYWQLLLLLTHHVVNFKLVDLTQLLFGVPCTAEDLDWNTPIIYSKSLKNSSKICCVSISSNDIIILQLCKLLEGWLYFVGSYHCWEGQLPLARLARRIGRAYPSVVPKKAFSNCPKIGVVTHKTYKTCCLMLWLPRSAVAKFSCCISMMLQNVDDRSSSFCFDHWRNILSSWVHLDIAQCDGMWVQEI